MQPSCPFDNLSQASTPPLIQRHLMGVGLLGVKLPQKLTQDLSGGMTASQTAGLPPSGEGRP